MRKMTRKFMALTMVGVLAATPLTAFATEATESPATGDTSGTGSIEGIVDKEIFSVVLPTIDEDDTTFDFIMDPQGLIAETEGEKYTSKSFEDGASLLFNNVAEGAAHDYSSKSDVLTAINKSSIPVDVAIDATITGLDGIDLVAADTDADTLTNPSISLALEVDDAATAFADGKASYTGSLNKAADDAYEIAYDTDAGEYVYALSDTAKGESYNGFDSVSFDLTGACVTNANVDWSATEDVEPTVTVTWKLEKHSDTPSVSSTAVTFTKGTALNIPVTLGTATDATVTISVDKNGTYSTMAGITFDSDSSAIVMDGTACSAASAGTTRYLKVTFNDEAATTAIIEVTIAAN